LLTDKLRAMRIRSELAVILLATTLVTPLTQLRGQDFQDAKVLDVSSFKVAGSPIIAPNNGYPVVIPTSRDVFTVTVALNDMSFSAEFSKKLHFNPSELIVGDSVPVRIDGDKLILKTPKGKEVKGKIMRRARLSPN
jgi:hypothetical protein